MEAQTQTQEVRERELFVEIVGNQVRQVKNSTRCIMKDEETIQRALEVWNAFNNLIREAYASESEFAKKAIQKVAETFKYCFWCTNIDVEELNVTIKKDIKILAYESVPDEENIRRVIWIREVREEEGQIVLAIDNINGKSWLIVTADVNEDEAIIRIKGYRMLSDVWPIFSVFYKKDWNRDDNFIIKNIFEKLYS